MLTVIDDFVACMSLCLASFVTMVTRSAISMATDMKCRKGKRDGSIYWLWTQVITRVSTYTSYRKKPIMTPKTWDGRTQLKEVFSAEVVSILFYSAHVQHRRTTVLHPPCYTCCCVYVLGYTLGSNKPTIVRHCTGLLTNYDCGCAISSVFLLHYEKPAGGLVVNITTLKSHWWQQWYVCQQVYHMLQNFIPQRACLYHLIAGWVLTFAHNNTPFGQHL